MKLYVADYTADVQHLTCEQDGAYGRLLRAMWRAGGKLPNVPEKLATICGLAPERWAEIGPDVLALFIRRGGALTHRRLRAEFAKAKTVSLTRREAQKAIQDEKRNKTKDKSSTSVGHLPPYLKPESKKKEDLGGGETRSRACDLEGRTAALVANLTTFPQPSRPAETPAQMADRLRKLA